MFTTCTVDFGEQTRTFCADFTNYRNTNQARLDNVEVEVDKNVVPAQLICFLGTEPSCSEPLIFALVRYYDIHGRNPHPAMQKPRVRLSDSTRHNSFHVVEFQAIRGHAYIVPDFNDVSNTFFFWDKVW